MYLLCTTCVWNVHLSQSWQWRPRFRFADRDYVWCCPGNWAIRSRRGERLEPVKLAALLPFSTTSVAPLHFAAHCWEYAGELGRILCSTREKKIDVNTLFQNCDEEENLLTGNWRNRTIFWYCFLTFCDQKVYNVFESAVWFRPR